MKYRVLLFGGIIALIVVARLLYLSSTSGESELYKSSIADTTNQKPTAPVINTNDLLTASDVQQGVINAIEHNNLASIDEWVEKMVEVARVAKLPADDIAYLRSNAAREYLIFNAKRALFNRAFEARFYALEDISDLEQRYPEAADLFSKAELLVAKRDSIIQSIAITLAGEQTPGEAHIEHAKRLWRERYQHNLN